jgi:decaprenylphospho-beta-D-erythro-pentofuranosid-2-ulose 2-reductase
VTARKVAILGALSAIAEMTARRLAARGDALLLAGRGAERLEQLAADLRLRGASRVETMAVDLTKIEDPFAFMSEARGRLEGLDAVLIFHGVMRDEKSAAEDIALLREILAVNFNSAVELAAAAAAELERSDHPHPTLVGVGSVAGDRGRASLRAYGAAKAGFATYLQALAQRGGASRVRVVMVKPGTTRTPMTAYLNTTGPLWSSADKVAADVVRALQRGGPTVYSPWFWRWILLVVRMLPHPVMARLRI